MLSNQAERLDADTGSETGGNANGHGDYGTRTIERPRLSLRDRAPAEMDVTGVVPMAGLVRGRRTKTTVEPSWPPPPRPRIVFRRDETAES